MSRPTTPFRTALLLSWFLLMVCGEAPEVLFAQTAPDATPDKSATFETTEETISLAQLVEQRKNVESAEELDEETRTAILELYRSAEDHLKRTGELAKQRANSQAATASAANRAEEAKRSSQQLESSQPATLDAETEVELKQERLRREQKLQEWKDFLSDVESQITDRPRKRQEIRERLAAVEQQQKRIQDGLAAEFPTGEKPRLSLARRAEMLTHQQLALEESALLHSELDKFDAEDVVELLSLNRRRAIVQIDLLTNELQLVEDALKETRRRAAQKGVAEAKDTAQKVHPSLKRLADYNQELAESNRALAVANDRAKQDRDQTRGELDKLRDRFDSTKKKVDGVGLPASMGTVLRKQRASLVDTRRYKTRLRARHELIDETQLRLFELDEERKQLSNMQPIAEQEISTAVLAGEEDDPEELKKEAIDLLVQREEYLDSLIRTQSSYFDLLAELSVLDRQIVKLSEEFTNYIDQRVLWVRSSPPITGGIQIQLHDVAALAPRVWWAAGRRLVADAGKHPVIFGIAAAVSCLLAVAVIPLRRRLSDVGRRAVRNSFSEFVPTIYAASMTVWLSLAIPLVTGFVGWRLVVVGAIDSDSSLRGLGIGFLAFAVTLLPLEVHRRMCCKNGLAEKHFQWSPTSVHSLCSLLGWLAVCLPGMVFVVVTIRASGEPESRNPVPLLVFVAVCATFTVFCARLFHPVRGIVRTYIQTQPDSWAFRLRYVWYVMIVSIPLSLIVLACLGYEYTARQLAVRVYVSFQLLAFVVVVYSLVARSVLVQRRKLRIAQARQRHAAAMAKREKAKGTSSDEGSQRAPLEIEEDPLADLQSQTLQTRRFVRTILVGAAFIGLWLTWSDVLPALGFLEKWPVWTSTTQINETVKNESGEVRVLSHQVPDPVTIAEVALAILIGIVTFAAAKNLPGLLEIAILRRLPLDRSVRYAITTLGSYLIVMVGLVITFKTVGLRWQQIQWMATALTFGLAFGLQEMFANFIAGIIILFERPIRVGDIVTVDGVTGTVSRVQMRATTITNFDRKDYIVPNKDFITGRVLNWTLSDQVNRIVIRVGIAYGSDKTLARQLLLQAAASHQVVEKEPEPQAVFEEFGDNALQFSLRCYISMRNMPHRLEVTDHLHTTIDDLFREAKIEIAFPQQDINIRAIPLPTESHAAVGNGHSIEPSGKR